MSDRWKHYFEIHKAFNEDWLRSAVPHWGFHEPLYGNIMRICPSPATIIDIGCGPGWSAIYLASLGYSVTGIDNDPRIIELAKDNANRLGSKAKFVCADATDLTTLDSTYDLAYSCGVLEHFDRNITVDLLNHQSRFAKHVLIQIPSKFTAYTGEITDERIYSLKQLRNIVTDAGLKVEKTFGYGELNATKIHRLLRLLLPRIVWRSMQNAGYCYSLAVIGSSKLHPERECMEFESER